MKERISVTIEPGVKTEFNAICKRIERKWGARFSKSQLIESMIVGWNKKNRGF